MPLKINPHDAPVGYIAVQPNIHASAVDLCRGCAFRSMTSDFCRTLKCTPDERLDKQNVIFVKAVDALEKEIEHAKEQIRLYDKCCGEAGSISHRQLEMWQYELESLLRKQRIAQR